MRMSSRFSLFLAAGTAICLLTPTLLSSVAASAAPATPHYKLTVAGIDRDGTPVGVQAGVYGATNGVQYLSGGSSVSLTPGYYEVAAAIWRAADGDTRTLVASRVHITNHNVAVTLNAQGAVPITETLNVPAGVTPGNQNAMVCIKGGGNVNSITGTQVSSSGTVYVQPSSAAGVSLVYQAYWQGTGALYDIGHIYAGGLPASPVYNDKVSGLVTVGVTLAANENSSPLQAVIASYGGCGAISLPEDLLPDVYTDYRSPGVWDTSVDYGPNPNTIHRSLFKEATYKAGHTYSDVFGVAAAGPAPHEFPILGKASVSFQPGGLFSDPVASTGFDCEGKGVVALYAGKTVVHSAKMTFCQGSGNFSAHVTKARWYTLNANFARWNSGLALSPTLLSTDVSLSWRFRFASVHGAEAAPIVVTQFRPEGLGAYNSGEGGFTTTVKVTVFRGGGQSVQTPTYRLKSVKVQASFDDGATWQSLKVTPHAGFWLVSIAQPNVNGYVSLRSIITDVAGDSSTETIIRAYQFENSD
jgi:hypothetical protein